MMARRCGVVLCGAILAWQLLYAGAQAQISAGSAAAGAAYRSAAALQNQGAYELAADEWAEFLADYGDDPLATRARHYLGVCRLQLKQYDDAVREFKSVLESSPDEEITPAAQLYAGLAEYNLARASGDVAGFQTAAKSLDRAATESVESKYAPQALYFLGEARYGAGEPAAAAAAYERLLDAYPDDALAADAMYALGAARQELGESVEAEKIYRRFLRRYAASPLAAEVGMRLGETLIDQGRLADGIPLLEEAARDDQFALADHALVRLAEAHFASGENARAAQVYERMLRRFPDSRYAPSAELAAGNCLYLAGDYEAAAPWFRKALARGGAEAPEAAHWLAQSMFNLNQPADAAAAASAGLAVDSGGEFRVRLLIDQVDATLVAPTEVERKSAPARFAQIAAEHSTDPEAPQALYLAAWASLQFSDFEAAAEYASKFAKTYPNAAERPDADYILAEARLQTGDASEAADILAALERDYPNNAELNAWRVRSALAAQIAGAEPAAVLEQLAAVHFEELTPEQRAEALFLQASAELQQENYVAARKSAEEAVAAAPQGPRASETWLLIARAARLGDDLEGGLEAAREAVASAQGPGAIAAAEYQRGEVLFALGRPDEALRAFAAAKAQATEAGLLGHILQAIAATQSRLGAPAAAAAAADELLQRNPQHPAARSARFVRASALVDQEKFAPALADLDALASSAEGIEDWPEALRLRAEALAGLGRTDEAVAALQAWLDRFGDNPAADRVRYDLAWNLRTLGREEEALEQFRSLAADDGAEAAEASFHVGQAAFAAGDFATAEAAYRAALAKSPAVSVAEKAWYKLGWALFQEEKFEEGAKAFRSQLEAAADGELASDARFMVGYCQFQADDYAAALESLAPLLSNAPARRDFAVLAALHAGQAAAKLKQFEESRDLLKAGLDQYGEDEAAPDLRCEYAMALYELGERDAAYEQFEQAADASLRESSAKARFMLGELLFERGEHAAAVRQFFKAAYGQAYPRWQADSLFEAARCFELLRQPEQALKSYRDLVERFPDSDKAAPAKERITQLSAVN